MEELTHDFLSFLPAALLTLAVHPRCTSSPPGVFWTVQKVTWHRGFISC